MTNYRWIITLSFLILILSPENLCFKSPHPPFSKWGYTITPLVYAQEPSSPQPLLDEGVSLFNSGKFKEAIGVIKEYLITNPDSYPAHYYLGVSSLRFGDTTAAKEELEKCLKLKPDYAPARLGLGNIYESLKRFDLARKEYEAVISISQEKDMVKISKDRLALINRAEAGGHIKEAERLIAVGQIEEAIKELLTAEGLTPENVRIPALLGSLYVQLDKIKEAIESYKKAEALIPKNPDVHLRLGKLYFNRNEYKEAIDEFNEVIRLIPDSDKAKEAANILREVESRSKGRGYFEEAANALKENRLDDALNATKKILELEHDNGFAYYNLGLIYKKKQMYKEATEALHKSLELTPDYTAARYQLGVIFDDQGEYSEAIKEYDAATAMGKADSEDAKKAAERSTLLKEILTIKEGEERIKALTKAGDLAGALREAEKVVAVTKNEKSFLSLGQVYLSRKEYDKAIDNLNKVIEINPRNWEAYISIGQAYEGKKLHKDAGAFYRKVATSVPDMQVGKDAKILMEQLEIKIHFADASEYKKKGDIDGALREVQSILELTPDDPVALYNAGVLYYLLEMPERAVPVLTKAIQKQPDYIQAHLQLALVYENMQKFEESSSEFKAVLGLGKEGREVDVAKERLGLLTEEQVFTTHMKAAMELIGKGKYEKALDEAKAIIIVAPKNYIAQYTIGFIFDRLDMSDEAKAAYLKAIELNPKYSRAHLSLARLYARQGLYDDARESYSKTISTGAGTAEAEMAVIGLEIIRQWHLNVSLNNNYNNVVSRGGVTTTGTSADHGLSFVYDIFQKRKKSLNITPKFIRNIYFESQKTRMGYGADILWSDEFQKNDTYGLSIGYTDSVFNEKPEYKLYRFTLSAEMRPDTVPSALALRLDYSDINSSTNKLNDITQYTFMASVSQKTSEWDGFNGNYIFTTFMNKDPLGSNFAYRANSLNLRYTKRLWPAFTAGTNLNMKLTEYMNPDSTTLFSRFRRNVLKGAGIDMSYRFSEKGSVTLRSDISKETTNLPSLKAEDLADLGEKLSNPIPRVGGWDSSQTLNISADMSYRLSEKGYLSLSVGNSRVATIPGDAGSYRKFNVAVSISTQF